MASHEFELQKAVFAALDGNINIPGASAVPVLDHVEDGSSAFPRVTFGEFTATDWSTKGQSGQEITFVLDVWDRNNHRGRKQVAEIFSAIHTLLHDTDLVVTGAGFCNVRFVVSQSLRDPDAKTRHGIARYRALVHES